MQHERLHVRILLFLDDSLRKEVFPAIEHILLHFGARIARERQSPYHVSRHPTVAVALLPPTPAAVAMLEIVKPLQASLRDGIQFGQIFLVLRMRGSGGVGFNAAEDAAHHVFGLQAEVAKGFGGDGGGQEAAHRLFGATVGVINQIRQRVQHRHRQARRELHGERRGLRHACRQIEFHGKVVSARLAGFGKEFLDAVVVGDVGFLHSIGVLVTSDGNFEFNRTRSRGACCMPVDTFVTLRGYGDCPDVSLHYNIESLSFQCRFNDNLVVCVVVNDGGNNRLVAHDEEARRLQADDERLLRARGRVGDAELVSRRSRPRGGFPAGERIGILYFHRGLAGFVRDYVWLPENRGAKIRADLHGGLLAAGWLLSWRLAFQVVSHPPGRHHRRWRRWHRSYPSTDRLGRANAPRPVQLTAA